MNTVTKKIAAKKTAKRKNSLLSSMEKTQSFGYTENLAKTFKSTLNANLDFFAMGAALRTRSNKEIENLFIKAKSEDKLLAMKCLFNIRNIRGGAGERKTFRIILRYLANNDPELVRKNLGNIVHFGRFDDLYELFGTKCEKDAMHFMAAQLDDDFKKMKSGEKISLASKWTKSLNASSKETKQLAEKFRSFLNISEKTYRKSLSQLRAYSNVLEVALSAGNWDSIDYSKLPSKAGLIYRDAFKKHDPVGYNKFLSQVKKGEKTINAGTLFPYEIVDKVFKGDRSETLDALWDSLPNYLADNSTNLLCICDVSGSMSGLPMAVSISLGIYTAERNKGDFANYFMTFSSNPTLQKVVGSNIFEKVNMLSRAEWDMSTNLQGAFSKILDHAIKNDVPAEEMPAQLIIISDMEFNSACRGGTTNLEAIRAKYKNAGYRCPSLVFWNVNSRKNNVAAQADDKGVLLVSGCSPSVFKTLLSGISYTPIDQMLETLNNPQYDCVVI